MLLTVDRVPSYTHWFSLADYFLAQFIANPTKTEFKEVELICGKSLPRSSDMRERVGVFQDYPNF